MSTVAVEIDDDFPSTGTANHKGDHNCEASAATTPSDASYNPTLSESFKGSAAGAVGQLFKKWKRS